MVWLSSGPKAAFGRCPDCTHRCHANPFGPGTPARLLFGHPLQAVAFHRQWSSPLHGCGTYLRETFQSASSGDCSPAGQFESRLFPQRFHPSNVESSPKMRFTVRNLRIAGRAWPSATRFAHPSAWSQETTARTRRRRAGAHRRRQGREDCREVRTTYSTRTGLPSDDVFAVIVGPRRSHLRRHDRRPGEIQDGKVGAMPATSARSATCQ